jgi:hypothetical protein
VNVRPMVTPVALVILAAGVAAYAYLVDRGSVSDADRIGRRSDVFPSFRVDEVARLQLVHGEETLVLERTATDGGQTEWAMSSPRRERADPAAVEVLLRELEMATKLREVGTNDAAGLNSPRVRGTVEMGAIRYRFALGSDAPRPEGAAYMRLDGEGNFVVDRSLKVQLLRGADAYRDRTLLSYGAGAIARLEVRKRSGESLVLERQGATFRVASLGLRASRAAIDRLMAALADGRAETFLDDATADDAVGAAIITVLVSPSTPGHERVELRLGGPCPGRPEDVVVVRATPERISACTPRAIVEALTATEVTALVDASPFFAHADEMEELRLEPVGRSGPRVDIARHGMGWHERAPEERDLTPDETDSANMLSLALAEAHGTEVRRADGRFEARTRVTIVRTGGGATEVVELAGPGRDGMTLVRRADDGALLQVTPEVARRFEPHPVALRARRVWPSPIDPASVVAIDDTCGPTKQRLELRDHVWTMRAPAGLSAGSLSLEDLLRTIAHAKTEAWIAEGDDGTFGFDGPGACTMTLTLDPDSMDTGIRRASITLGAAGDGGFYAHTSDDPAVFVASPGLRETLVHPAIDGQRFQRDARDGTRD